MCANKRLYGSVVIQLFVRHVYLTEFSSTNNIDKRMCKLVHSNAMQLITANRMYGLKNLPIVRKNTTTYCIRNCTVLFVIPTGFSDFGLCGYSTLHSVTIPAQTFTILSTFITADIVNYFIYK